MRRVRTCRRVIGYLRVLFCCQCTVASTARAPMCRYSIACLRVHEKHKKVHQPSPIRGFYTKCSYKCYDLQGCWLAITWGARIPECMFTGALLQDGWLWRHSPMLRTDVCGRDGSGVYKVHCAITYSYTGDRQREGARRSMSSGMSPLSVFLAGD